MKNIFIKIIESWKNAEGNMNTLAEIKSWIDNLKRTTKVSINECSFDESSFWFYDEINGEILNRKRSFFQIKGIQEYLDNELKIEQPIIVQPEIGYLGIICKELDGVINFLMQAKIEPGNINVIQISPTIQATKSNFTKAHGGRLPNYLEYFENASKYMILVDQIQSEQGSRFYKKRNRNMIIRVDEDVEVLPNFKWMTLGQIKKLMYIENLVNMDTRTVLSGISYAGLEFSQEELEKIEFNFSDKALFRSVFSSDNHEYILSIYKYINDYKMFHNNKLDLVSLDHLGSWKVSEYGVKCKKDANFEVGFYKISIEGREVQNWTQPLFKAKSSGTLGLILCEEKVTTKFLITVKPEIGLFDMVEIGPSVHFEPVHDETSDNIVESLFRKYTSVSYKEQKTGNSDIICDVILSEEGGRFYHEQNRNVILKIEKEELKVLPPGYFWVNYYTLATLLKINNCLNIQLRNLLSLIEI